MKPPSERQRVCLEFIQDYLERKGYPPSIREICAHMGVTSTNGVNDHIAALSKKGLVVRTRHASRGLRVTEDGLRALGRFPDSGQVCPNCGHDLAGNEGERRDAITT